MAVLHFMLKLLIFPHCGRMMNTVQMAPATVLVSLAIRKKTIKTRLVTYGTISKFEMHWKEMRCGGNRAP